ncbi:hypothetical protein EYZ11_011599 [Aspergillus tanneri]|uniref:C2H2-type domain-containing protein n=1 Tax=Aspergillus tanneri TaxID=1220188 RepID=A0A4S3J2P5_9EURO|nr:hypothetical protein EYZ11_011599 [Aspergillus tanneri]
MWKVPNNTPVNDPKAVERTVPPRCAMQGPIRVQAVKRSKAHFKCVRCQHTSQEAAGSPTPQCAPKIQVQSVALSDGQSPYCGACDRKFVDATALRQHLNDKKHVKPKKKALRNCEKCNKSFASTTALRQHKGYDKDRIITTPVMLLDTSFTGTALSSSASSFSDIVYTPTEGSEIDSDWEMERSVIAPLPRGVDRGPVPHKPLSCPICSASGKKRMFANQTALEMHISSAAHAGRPSHAPSPSQPTLHHLPLESNHSRP